MTIVWILVGVAAGYELAARGIGVEAYNALKAKVAGFFTRS
jgi:hypothetical protein